MARIRWCRHPSERIYQICGIGAWTNRETALAVQRAHSGSTVLIVDEFHGMGRDYGHVRRVVIGTIEAA